MDGYESKALYIKVGKIERLKTDKKEYESAIKKRPVAKAKLTKTGFSEDEQADKVHHGGEDKAILMLPQNVYEKINKAKNLSLAFDEVAYFGENIIVQGIDENDVCVGDILTLGGCVVEVSQPREPCWKLSANTDVSDMTKLIYKEGLTGWYARVAQGGTVEQDDKIELIKRRYPTLTIAALNLLMQNPKADISLYEEAINCEALGAAFKKSLAGKFSPDLNA